MSFSQFMKKNKKVRPNQKFAPTVSLTDADGKPLEFEFKHLTTREDESIRDSCTIEVQITGKPNVFRPKLNVNQYLAKMIAKSCVSPDLNNAELQDSYGVMTAEDLIREMIDDPGEYQDLCKFIQEFNGFNTTMQDKIDEAKN